jgi:hypothetical protein
MGKSFWNTEEMQGMLREVYKTATSHMEAVKLFREKFGFRFTIWALQAASQKVERPFIKTKGGTRQGAGREKKYEGK